MLPTLNEQALRTYLNERIAFLGIQFVGLYVIDAGQTEEQAEIAQATIWSQARELFRLQHVFFDDSVPSLREWAMMLMSDYRADPVAWERKRQSLTGKYFELPPDTDAITKATTPRSILEYRRAIMASSD